MILFDQLILNTDETKYGGCGELKSSQYMRTCDKRCYLHSISFNFSYSHLNALVIHG